MRCNASRKMRSEQVLHWLLLPYVGAVSELLVKFREDLEGQRLVIWNKGWLKWQVPWRCVGNMVSGMDNRGLKASKAV